jgi:hypothetical protein
MSELTQAIGEIIQNLTSHGFLWLFVFACFIIFLLTIWLLSRRARLWYWKVSPQVDALKSIDLQLRQLGEEIKENPIYMIKPEEAKDEVAFGTETAEEQTEEEPEKTDGGAGKAAKVYTEEELDELIKE